ncbi:nadph-dependent fmn reductase [Lucifera butyrica]|uniref:Nadph-dependent fmn reductase n=1 Tax=Lucifera butyrica TaxID=1351585 RepID=A0A498R7T9_9FIRM|nr:NAD(P)H-dependent oxidoreductase [Lucifera butyrica]VBB06977.1 nadph-dependent fmn reductase [Lucifera butyrica]
MKIVVLNGSPKGEMSVTMQYVAFLQQKFSRHTWQVMTVSQRIGQIERDDTAFQEIMTAVAAADGVVWAVPVYFMLVPSPYKRFIELVEEKNATGVFRQKYTAVLTTSIRFYDHTAHNYLRGICDDWDMNYAGGYSADMRDLFAVPERQRLLQFGAAFFQTIERQAATAKMFLPLRRQEMEYHPVINGEKLDCSGKRILLITDATADDTNLNNMITQFCSRFGPEPEVANLNDLDMKGGCLGCIRCAYDNTCCYEDKDEFVSFFEAKVKKADILVFAASMRDRYFSSRWKMFFDRSFYNNHVPVMEGKQFAFLISGPFSQNENLRQIVEAYIDCNRANAAGIVTDEGKDSAMLDRLIAELAYRALQCSREGYIQPPTFLFVGARKLFRDSIWGDMRFPFIADHKYYKEHGYYDFPTRNTGVVLRNTLLNWLMKIPKLRRLVYMEQMRSKMVEPYQKLLQKL